MSSPRPRTLSDWLRSRPDEWLACLLAARPDLAVPVPADMGVLASRIGVRVSAGRALEALDAFSLQVLDGLLLAGAPASYAELRQLVGDAVPEEAVRAALERLRGMALVWGEDDELHVVGSVRDLSPPYPAGLGRPVAILVASLTDAQVAPILAALGLPERRQPSATDSIAREFGKPERVRDLLAGCGSDERRALADLDAGPPIGQLPGAQRPIVLSEETSPVRRLLAHGLLVAVGPDTVEMPREVGLVLRGGSPLGPVRIAPPPLQSVDIGQSTVDKTAAGQVLTVLRQAESMLELFGLDPPPELRSGGLGIRELRRIAKALDLTAQQAALYLEMCAAAGLLDHSPGPEPGWLPTRAFDLWLSRTPEQRWAQLATAWVELTTWPALVGQRDDRDKPINVLSYEVSRTWAASTRQRVLDVLAGAPAGSAVGTEAVVEQLVWRWPRRGFGAHPERVAAVLAEGEHLGLLGRGALSTAGRATLRGEDASAVLVGLLPDPVDHVLIQADLTVVAPGPLEPALGREISAVADIESSGGATVYRIDENTVRRALDSGRTAADLQELFRTRSRTPVPQALSYLVEDVARRHGRLRTGAATAYLRCDDESLIAELVADRRTTALRLRRIAPTVLIAGVPVAALLEALRGAGYAPVAEDPEGTVLLSRPESKRLGPRSHRPRSAAPSPSPVQLREAVRKIRAGDRAARSARRMPVGTTRVPGVTTAATLEVLQQAMQDERQVWLGYVDADGASTQRIVDVVSLSGGFLQTFDHTAGAPRTFSLHRIMSVALVDPTD